MIEALVEAMETAERPVFYTGGGVINSGPKASALLRELVEATGFPVTSTLMGLGAYPASGRKWLGMLGMHGLYEANPRDAWLRPDDQHRRAFRRPDHGPDRRISAPASQKAHIDIDPSSINKVIHADFPIIGDVAHVLEDMLRIWKARGRKTNSPALKAWWAKIEEWRKVKCLSYKPSEATIKPQYALERLEALTQGA